MNTPSFEYLPHPADVRFTAHGTTLEETFEQAAYAMFGVIIQNDTLEPEMSVLVHRAVGDITALRNTRLVGERMLWRMAPDRRSRLSLIWESAFPSGKVMKEIYPRYRGSARPLYMIRRALDLLQRWK